MTNEFEPEDRAELTDGLYQYMVANPDERVPFLVNWAKLSTLGLS